MKPVNCMKNECALSIQLCKELEELKESQQTETSNLLDVALSTAKELRDMLQNRWDGLLEPGEQAHEKERNDADIRKLAGKCEAYRDVIWMILDKR